MSVKAARSLVLKVQYRKGWPRVLTTIKILQLLVDDCQVMKFAEPAVRVAGVVYALQNSKTQDERVGGDPRRYQQTPSQLRGCGRMNTVFDSS